MFKAASFVIARTWKQPRFSSAEEWMKNIWHIYTLEYYSAVKQQYLESCMQMDGTRKHHPE